MSEEKKAGRPREIVNIVKPDVVRKLAQVLTMRDEDIATVLDISETSLKNNFKEDLAKGRAEGRNLLGHWQWKNASKGNTVMQIWLGKNYMGQTDKTENTLKGAPDNKLVIQFFDPKNAE